MRSLRVGAFVPVCGCFHQLSTSSHASPSIHSTRPEWSIYCACLYGAQVCDPLIDCVWHVNFGWLSMNTPAWLQEVSSNICIDLAYSHYPFHVFDVQLCFCRCSGMRPTNLLCLACEFWVAINEQSDMTTECKLQYLQFFASCHYPFHVFDVKVFSVVPQVLETWLTCFHWHMARNTWIVSIEIVRKCLFNTRVFSYYFHLCCWEIQKSCLPALSAARYATHWFIVFGMWLSGGCERTIRHVYSK